MATSQPPLILKSMEYIIEYEVYDIRHTQISKGRIKVRNADSQLHAKVKLEGYLRKRHARYHTYVCVDCKEINPLTDFFENEIFKN